MKYTLLGKETSKTVESVCFGGIGDYSRPFLTKGQKAEDFRGVRLNLQSNTQYGKQPTETREFWDRHHDMITARYFRKGDLDFTVDKDGIRTGVFYPATTPMYLMVSSASLYRLHENVSSYEKGFTLLEERPETQHWTPLVKHFATLSVQNQGDHGLTREALNSANLDKRQFFLRGSLGHLPWYPTQTSFDTLWHMHAIDRDYIYENVPNMYEQLVTLGRLSYVGRDSWWKSPEDSGNSFYYGLQGPLQLKNGNTSVRRSSRNSYSTFYYTTWDEYVDAWDCMNANITTRLKQWGIAV